MKRILLFSSPRSGFTLLANIVRSHPRVSYFNEIFTRAPYLLPNFETAFQSDAANLRLPFETDLAHLKKYKLERLHCAIHRNRLIKTAVFLFYKGIASLQSRLFPNRKWGYFHKIYHLNSLHEPPLCPFYQTQFVKNRQLDILFIKDVRMRKAYFAFRDMYPDAYFIYLIRNPFYVVASTLQQRQIKKCHPC